MKFSPPPGTVAPGPTFGRPISSPIQTTVPDRRPPSPGARHCRLGPHSARTSDPPSSARPGRLPHLPLLFFSSPLLGKETSMPPHRAPIAGRAVAASSSTQVVAPPLSLTVSTGAAPNQAPEAGHFFW
jgi:hypothetical protein